MLPTICIASTLTPSKMKALSVSSVYAASPADPNLQHISPQTGSKIQVRKPARMLQPQVSIKRRISGNWCSLLFLLAPTFLFPCPSACWDWKLVFEPHSDCSDAAVYCQWVHLVRASPECGPNLDLGPFHGAARESQSLPSCY